MTTDLYTLNAVKKLAQADDWAEQYDIRDQFVEDAGAMVEALQAAVVIGEFAVKKHGHPRGGKFIVGKSFAERWTANIDHYREYFNVFEVVI